MRPLVPAAVAVSAAGLAAALFLGSAAAGTPGGDPRPGPPVMSDAERALVADPAKGLEHGVILLQEVRIDEDRRRRVMWQHTRAKVLSPNGRDLGNVEIDVPAGTRLDDFWARAILPDGRVVELPRSALVEDVVATGALGMRRRYRAALPEVVPGCVVDVGWSYAYRSIVFSREVPIQARWPVREFRLRWQPLSVGWGYAISRGHGLAIAIKADDDGGVLAIDATDLPAVRVEPHMPPLSEAAATARLYYSGAGPRVLWMTLAAVVEKDIEAYAGGAAAGQLLAGMPGAGEGPAPARVAAIYNALQARVRSTWWANPEETSAERDRAEADGEVVRPAVADLLGAGRASPYRIACLYAALARRAGAAAHLVFVPDRRDRLFDPAEPDGAQFDGVLVAVRPDPEGAELFVAEPGSGLPFREVSWWLTGVRGLLLDPREPQALTIPLVPPERNALRTEARITWDGEGTRTVTWAAHGSGAWGRTERRSIVAAPEPRRAALREELCGASGGRKATRAEVAAPANPLAPFELSCTLTEEAGETLAAPRELRARIDGPWLREVPALAPGRRDHLVLLPFAWTEALQLDVDAPPGYRPAAAPPPLSAETDANAYALRVRATDTGYRVERELRVGDVIVPLEAYPAFAAFLERVRGGDAIELLFVRQEAPDPPAQGGE